MSFIDTWQELGAAWEAAQPLRGRPDRIQAALQKDVLDTRDLLDLLSPEAAPHLEAMARRAADLTRRHFGRTIQVFTPLYVSSYCSNVCLYCGFRGDNQIRRGQLSLEEVAREADAIAAEGFQHLLQLTGDAKAQASIEYLEHCLAVLRRRFSAIGIEIYACTREEYRRLIDAGVDALTLYQETYRADLYERLHVKGPKRDFRFRLEAPERALEERIRAVNVGALYGLDDWRRETFFVAGHARWLQDRWPEAEVGCSLPRLCAHEGDWGESRPVSDRDLVQAMLALRCFMPRLGMTLSTREQAAFRDHLMGLGITRMSASVSTAVGGHAVDGGTTPQFTISDTRTLKQLCADMRARGFQPVYRDWQSL